MDAVINHMCGYGSGVGHGSDGSWYGSQDMLFPAVPYGPADFNDCGQRCDTPSCDVENYADADQVHADILE